MLFKAAKLRKQHEQQEHRQPGQITRENVARDWNARLPIQ